jgi:hypothetical protein
VRFFCISLLILVTGRAADLNQIVADVRAEVQPAAAMERMRRLYSTDRWFTFPRFQETAEYVAAQMKAAGLQQVFIGAARADGKARAGFWTMPLAWDVRNATLEIVEPVVAPGQRILADYRQVPASLGMWSGPTPPSGFVAELIEIKPADIGKRDLKGKIVLASDPRGYKSALAKAGVAGAINTFTENERLRDGYQWMNAWGDRGWAFNAGDSPLVLFSLSPNKRDFVRSLLARGPVKVRATVSSRYYEGVYPWVTGIIPGKHPAEEVLLLGHAFEQGAQDNATGVSAMLEAMAAINRLIAAGKLERPRRSIRLLVMGEMYGSMDYIQKYPERIRNTVAAMCLDTPAASYEIAGTEYSFYMNPHVSASWVDALILRVAEEYFPAVKRPWHEKPFTPGTDTFLSDPMIGVPATWAYSGSGVETHHNSEDTPDRVDERSLRDISIVTAAFMYCSAAAETETDVKWVRELVLTRAYGQITHAAGKAVESVLRVRGSSDLARVLAEGIERVRYVAGRQKQAVESVARLGPAVVTSDRIAAFEEEQIGRVRAAAGDVAPAVRSPNVRPENLVVIRKRFGTLPLDDLPVDQRHGYPSGAWSVRLITALYWCDGRRSLDDVIRLTRLELGPDKFDWIGYFRFLAKHGYVSLRETSDTISR